MPQVRNNGDNPLAIGQSPEIIIARGASATIPDAVWKEWVRSSPHAKWLADNWLEVVSGGSSLPDETTSSPVEPTHDERMAAAIAAAKAEPPPELEPMPDETPAVAKKRGKRKPLSWRADDDSPDSV